ncbi:phosphoenolpyruvate carboxykinase (ATP) [Acetobacter thailandicus]|uniref:phosphoenolpyruvate carboxykinase (ATP) n=1 Tax=Acetobacter thailandicus TaxID=1502842 RepID=UPI001BABE9FE|nr:phosphoenolpyruvate carboxykinase (ATP) [Acetobacter thailandicus]MBS0981290.1 phosphoenolpyruvate carboxykinase (ATP) [Acetobacter thailandicus]
MQEQLTSGDLECVSDQKRAGVLSQTGVNPRAAVYPNLAAPELVTLALRRHEGTLSENGALVVHTGVHTGRSAKDKFVVDEPQVRDQVWWTATNQKMAPENFRRLKDTVTGYLAGQPLFTQDLYAGADAGHRIKIRLVTTNAWHALFARNIFIRPVAEDLESFTPDYVILHAPDLELDPEELSLRSVTAVALSFEQKLIIIAGTQYGGEIKKSIFTVMNWLLPVKGVLPMHCSANIDKDNKSAFFFGLSGTGKTTLSSDRNRPLIGDDEHGWSDEGVFNFEGGCYAKVIRLNKEAEPDIWNASHQFGVVLENVVTRPGGKLDLDDASLTENTRACYPADFIPGAVKSGVGGQPDNVLMLTADAFGVLPPVAKLTPEQAMYHFLSGYTARIAGTEKGLGNEPQATFSACFGAPFLPRPPAVYGELLRSRLSKGNVSCWLVNTGWVGGAYGEGKRMSLAHTRAILSAVLSGELDSAEFEREEFFGLYIPKEVKGVPANLLNPSHAWPDQAAYAVQAKKLAELFVSNSGSFIENGSLAFLRDGIKG